MARFRQVLPDRAGKRWLQSLIFSVIVVCPVFNVSNAEPYPYSPYRMNALCHEKAGSIAGVAGKAYAIGRSNVIQGR